MKTTNILGEGAYAQGISIVMDTCRKAWSAGLMMGFNGNMSLRVGADAFLVTASSTPKGHLSLEDVALADLKDGSLLAGRALSSETAMHVAAYAGRPDASCVLHTHPTHLLALAMRLDWRTERLFDMPLCEAEAWRKRLAYAPEAASGSDALARGVGEAARCSDVILMLRHGLCVVADSPAEALALSEQVDHLARMQLMLL